MHRPAIYPDLADKTVFITGGGSGIGAALTEGFAAQGARVAFVDIAEEPSRALVARLADSAGGAPLFIPCDIRDVPALKAAVERAGAELGDVAVLMNNAATSPWYGHICDTDPAMFDKVMQVNVRGYFYACAHGAKLMARNGQL